MKYLRIDDFPNGDLALHNHWRQLGQITKPHFKAIKPFLDILNRHKVNYILGVTPELCDLEDVKFLNDNLGEGGWTVMHGFNHAWNYPWDKITDTWAAGGEFSLLNKSEIRDKYLRGLAFLSQIKSFNTEHFIPPFNCYNQNLLDVLSENNVKYIHGCSKEDSQFNLNALNHHEIKKVSSEWQKTYCDIDAVLNYLDYPSQITLHWIYDFSRQNALTNYKFMCQRLGEEYKN